MSNPIIFINNHDEYNNNNDNDNISNNNNNDDIWVSVWLRQIKYVVHLLVPKHLRWMIHEGSVWGKHGQCGRSCGGRWKCRWILLVDLFLHLLFSAYSLFIFLFLLHPSFFFIIVVLLDASCLCFLFFLLHFLLLFFLLFLLLINHLVTLLSLRIIFGVSFQPYIKKKDTLLIVLIR